MAAFNARCTGAGAFGSAHSPGLCPPRSALLPSGERPRLERILSREGLLQTARHQAENAAASRPLKSSLPGDLAAFWGKHISQLLPPL